jgi:hypothetical protein
MIVQKSVTVLHTLLKRLSPDKRASYVKFLPESMPIELVSENQKATPASDLSLQELFEKIDDSWYLDKLSTFSKNDLTFFLSLFSPKKRDLLSEKLGITPPFYSFSKDFELYSLNLLFKELFPNDLPLPLSYISNTPLSFLCSGGPEKLHKLAFYLGLFDISMELKSVLKGSILKQIQTTLFQDEVAFCREISEYRHVISLGPLGLAHWNEDSEVLRKVIFERGLYRLSIGLSNSSPDFIWYILHFIHKDIAKRLEKQPKLEIDTKIFEIALNQIEIAWKGVCTVLN